jgi:hypothetical protein
MSRVQRIMEQYGCSSESACRFIDLREEGHGVTAAALMAGLSDPPDSDREQHDYPTKRLSEIGLTAAKLNELHRLPDVRNALLDYQDDPCDDTALPLMQAVAAPVADFGSAQGNTTQGSVSHQTNADLVLRALVVAREELSRARLFMKSPGLYDLDSDHPLMKSNDAAERLLAAAVHGWGHP